MMLPGLGHHISSLEMLMPWCFLECYPSGDTGGNCSVLASTVAAAAGEGQALVSMRVAWWRGALRAHAVAIFRCQ